MTRPAVSSIAKSGWPPAALTFAVLVVLLQHSGVALADIAIFSAYVLGCLVVPGTLIWRAVTPMKRGSFVADVVFGTGLAYAVELAVYLLCRWIDQPRFVLMWPIVTIVVSLLPRWRHRVWTQPQTSRQPMVWSWSMAAVVTYALVWIAREVWRLKSISTRGLRSPYVDDGYQLGLVAELRHHFPISSPFVNGEPLYYHWFAHGEIAATSWATGIEPIVLLQRLSMLPMIVVFLMGSAILTGMFCRSQLPGLVAPLILVLGGADLITHYPNLYLSDILYLSPTTTFAQVLLVPALAVISHLLAQRSGRDWILWLTFALVAWTIAGSKATLVPILCAGLLAALVVQSILYRRVHRKLLLLLAISLGIFLLAARLIYGGGSRGLVWDPGVASALDAVSLGLVPDPASIGTGLSVEMFLLYVLANLSFVAAWIGFQRGGQWRDPVAQILVAGSVAGFAATFLLSGSAFAQLYFLYVTPFLFAVSAAWGFASLCSGLPVRIAAPPAVLAGLTGAITAGVISILVSQGVLDVWSPSHPAGLFVPYGIAALVIVIVAVVGRLVTGRGPGQPRLTSLLVVACILGMGVPAGILGAVDNLQNPPGRNRLAAPITIAQGGIAAARWLRDHSDPDDLVATNAHCQPPPPGRPSRKRAPNQPCLSQHFWISGYSERHILIEGWAYETTTLDLALEHNMAPSRVPFWRPDRLRANDEAFSDPTPAAIDWLRKQGVSWLFVDLRAPSNLEALEQLADLQFRSGPFAVFSLSK